ncbi:solute carrier organic anion transporter family member 1B3-like [Ptychodera flava]|uniref:solute carrier organic anion transporter family member 1B3-like n=1 Tax=Ptychodera flava TaxID=63121 RepID=UPI00396A7FC7
MMWGIGPISGNLIAAACLLVYVDFNRVDESSIELTPSDREWLGAWWVGTFVGAWMLIVVALPYFFIPKRLETKEDCGKREMAFHLSKNEQKFSFGPKGFLKATYRLLKNPLYIFPTLGYAFDLSTTMGILPFIPKYFEEQFGLNPTSANIYTGIFASLPYGLGMILGGYMIKRLNMQTLGMSKFMVFVVAVGTLLCAAFYPLTCGDTYVAGMG